MGLGVVECDGGGRMGAWVGWEEWGGRGEMRVMEGLVRVGMAMGEEVWQVRGGDGERVGRGYWWLTVGKHPYNLSGYFLVQ